MPIYAYKCGSCGHAKDVLQKMSDDPLTVCPACGAAAFSKQLTAAGFQLKGSGWYATDFRNGPSPAPAAAGDADKPADGTAKPADAPAKASEPAAAAPAVAAKADAPPAVSGS
jgi:putative FmdB family regulatory protein